jgi:hypothetical protein
VFPAAAGARSHGNRNPRRGRRVRRRAAARRLCGRGGRWRLVAHRRSEKAEGDEAFSPSFSLWRKLFFIIAGVNGPIDLVVGGIV